MSRPSPVSRPSPAHRGSARLRRVRSGPASFPPPAASPPPGPWTWGSGQQPPQWNAPPGQAQQPQPGHLNAPGYGGTPGHASQSGYGAPPYGPGGGSWGQPPWPPPGQWPWAQQAPQPHVARPFGSGVFPAAVAVAVAVAAVLGVVIGHALWKNATASGNSPGVSSPFGFGGGGGNITNPGNSSGQGSSASGGPSNAASIASGVDPGLVDVNTDLSYQGLGGAGTGMVLTPSGEVLTNNHVIEGATKISVTDVGNHKAYSATVVGYDRSQDVAVLQLSSASGLQTVTTADSSKVNTGQGVVAIGNANGAGGTPSYAAGSITGTNQSISASDEVDSSSEQLTGMLETNADIIEGDSGGPLVNTSGQVVGMDTAGSAGFQVQSPANEGFAIPINSALSIARKIEAGQGSAAVHIGPTAFLGVEVRPSGSNVFGGGSGSGSAQGALIADVVSGGPADQAGLQGGDVITSLDGHNVTTPSSLTSVMLGERPGASVQVQYVDNSGQSHSTTVKLASGPPQ